MNITKKQIKMFAAVTSFVLAALGSKISLAYWANAVTGNNTPKQGHVLSGTWDRYTTGTAISTCAALKTNVLTPNTSATFYLTQDINCSTTTSPTSQTSTFSGTLYGNGYTISNFTLSNARRGLFYFLSGAKIQNLILNNINVGTASSRSTGATGILASTNSGANTVISRIRIYNSALYVTTAGSAGGIIGRSTASLTITNAMVQNVAVNSTSANSGIGSAGIVGRTSAATTISDVYYEGTLTSPYNSGGIVGLIESTGALTLNRAVTFANASLRATTANAGGAVGRNDRSGGQSLTDFFYSGAIYSPSNLAGTIYTGTAMTYTNAWAAQWSWSNTPTIAYTAMTGTSANYTTNYVALRSSLSLSWWATNMPNIANNPFWVYDPTTFLFELKPRV